MNNPTPARADRFLNAIIGVLGAILLAGALAVSWAVRSEPCWLGVVDPPPAEILAKYGPDREFLTDDCGFSWFYYDERGRRVKIPRG